jgi:hypothetical protein
MAFVVPWAPFCPAAAAFDAAAPAISIALAFGVALAFGAEAVTVMGAATVVAFNAATIFFLPATFAHFLCSLCTGLDARLPARSLDNTSLLKNPVQMASFR